MYVATSRRPAFLREGPSYHPGKWSTNKTNKMLLHAHKLWLTLLYKCDQCHLCGEACGKGSYQRCRRAQGALARLSVHHRCSLSRARHTHSRSRHASLVQSHCLCMWLHNQWCFWSSTPPHLRSPAERVFCSPDLSLTCSALQRPAPPQKGGESSSLSTARLHQRCSLPARSLRIQQSLWRDSRKPLRLALRNGVPVQAARDGPHEAVCLLPSPCIEHSIYTPGGI